MEYVKEILILMLFIKNVFGMGEVHTSVESVARLVSIEDSIIKTLEDYLRQEEERINTIKRLVVFNYF